MSATNERSLWLRTQVRVSAAIAVVCTVALAIFPLNTLATVLVVTVVLVAALDAAWRKYQLVRLTRDVEAGEHLTD